MYNHRLTFYVNIYLCMYFEIQETYYKSEYNFTTATSYSLSVCCVPALYRIPEFKYGVKENLV